MKEEIMKLEDRVEEELKKKGIAKRYNHKNKTYTTKFNHFISRFNISWLQNPAFQVSYHGVKGSPEAVTFGTKNIYVNPHLQPRQAAKALYKEFLHIDTTITRTYTAPIIEAATMYTALQLAGAGTTLSMLITGVTTAALMPINHLLSRKITNNTAENIFIQ